MGNEERTRIHHNKYPEEAAATLRASWNDFAEKFFDQRAEGDPRALSAALGKVLPGPRKMDAPATIIGEDGNPVPPGEAAAGWQAHATSVANTAMLPDAGAAQRRETWLRDSRHDWARRLPAKEEGNGLDDAILEKVADALLQAYKDIK